MFLTPTVASAADASTQDEVSNSDTILRASSLVSTRHASEAGQFLWQPSVPAYIATSRDGVECIIPGL